MRSKIRDRPSCTIGDLCPSSSPVTTTASTPDAPASSAGRYASQGVSSETTPSATGSSMRERTFATSQPTTSPISSPPRAATTNSHAMSNAETDPPMAATATRSSTSAVASLSRLSPSRMVTTRRGMPTRRAIEVAATASGGATTAPSANATAGSTGVSHQVISPMPKRGEDDQPDRQQRDRAPVAVEVDQRGADRRRVEQRREEAEEHDLRVELDVQHVRDVRDAEAHDHQQQRRGHLVATGEHAEDDHHGREQHDVEGRVHSSRL